MKRKVVEAHERQWWVWGVILLIAFAILGGGYWMYYQSIESAVYSTTLSFMEQIADHDHLNIVNQMDSKREYLQTMLSRIEAARKSRIEEVVYNLGVESKTTSFDTLYLISEDGQVYSSTYLTTPLENMPWADEYRQADSSFVSRYDEVSREQWGEFLSTAFICPARSRAEGKISAEPWVWSRSMRSPIR